MRKIDVEYNEFRNWKEPVNVVVLEDEQVVWCSHIETYFEEEGEDIDVPGLKLKPRPIEICMHCGAWRTLGGEWDK